ncbi:tripartite tricarboxylate transporter substrate binding protein [Ramlibacter sp. 2FC]|uniref:tripartite tricarboxylate transporter substrate binding protein n=1 Tax=Ramlibacter sp. 2FC TaxID=2502188 RepID=UPI0010F72045|nr:tripartite tricarboxylate transporter substrate binding protein [Ramlibacter sp. 2FC]
MNLTRKLTGLLAGLLLAGAALAQSYPTKPVMLMVPYPAGGLSDIIARKVNAALAKELGQPVIIENLGGAGGAIAAQKVLNAPADGYYLFQGSPNELILAPLAISAVKYRPEDFRMVQRVALAPLAVVARGDFPARNADELVAYAQKMAREGKPVTYASVGNGSFYHLLGEQMAKVIGAPMTHVPYKGGGPILQDLLGGQIDIFITPYGAPHVAMDKERKLKFVTVLSKGRQPLVPHVPAVDEGKALKGFHYSIGSGYFVRKDTPEPIVQVLHKALSKVLGDADLRATLAAQGQLISNPLTLDEAANAYVSDMTLYRGIARTVNLQAQ